MIRKRKLSHDSNRSAVSQTEVGYCRKEYTLCYIISAVISEILIQFILKEDGQFNIKVLTSNVVLLVLLFIAIQNIGFGRKWARNLFIKLR